MKARIAMESPARALDRFESLWNRMTEGEVVPDARVVSFSDLPLLLRTLTPARWQLLALLREMGPVSVYALARRLQRDYKNVHGDVARCVELGLITKADDDRVLVEWDAMHAEFRLDVGDQTQPALRNR